MPFDAGKKAASRTLFPQRQQFLFYSDNLVALETGRFQARIGYLLAILELADKRVGVFLLVQVSKRVVDASVARLVGANVQQKILHGLMTLWHSPVLQHVSTW